MKMAKDINKIKKEQSGFTIAELMIATAVFATVLMVLTFGVIQITRSYYKGVTETTTQNLSRNVLSTISQDIAYNGGNVSQVPVSATTAGNTYGFCIGSTRFYYQLGYEVKTSPDFSKLQGYHGLVQLNNDSTCPSDCGYSGVCSATTCPGASFNVNLARSNTLPCNAQELLQPDTRLSKLLVSPPTANAPDLYSLDVQVSYGDEDLLCNTSVSISGTPSCSSNAIMPSAADFVSSGSGVVECKGTVGQEFCATSELQTDVQKRVQ